MAALQSNTTDDASSQPIMKIHSNNYQVDGDVTVYPEELNILIVALRHSVLSTAMFSSFEVPMSWLSMAGSTASYNKTLDTVTFNLINCKKFFLTKKFFFKTLAIPNSPHFYKVTNEQVLHIFNEMGYQPTLLKISEFKKSSLPSL